MSDDFLLEPQTGTLFPAITNPSVSNGKNTNDGATATPMVPLPPTATPMVRIPPTESPYYANNNNNETESWETGYAISSSSSSSALGFNIVAGIGFVGFLLICLFLLVRCCKNCGIAAKNRTLGHNHNQIAGARDVQLERNNKRNKRNNNTNALRVPEGTTNDSPAGYPVAYAAHFAATATEVPSSFVSSGGADTGGFSASAF